MSAVRPARGLAGVVALLAAVALFVVVPGARASTTQSSILEASSEQLLSHPDQTLQTLRSLGVGIVKLTVPWDQIAPLAGLRVRPPLFDASNPADYPQSNWAPYDMVVSRAKAYGLRVELVVDGGAPLWATAYNAVSGFQWQWSPSPTEYGQFVQAVGRRFPSVHFWELWNEPNWGASLAPQYDANPPAVLSVVNYRSMLDLGWRGLQQAGHGGDTIIAGGLAPDGSGPPLSPISTIAPLAFVRTLYCADDSFQELRGSAAQQFGCPTTAAESQQFRADYPGLFQLTGFGVHPYSIGAPPTKPFFTEPDGVEFAEIPQLIATVDRLQQMYGSSKQMAIYNTEFGYETKPPQPLSTGFTTPQKAAGYMNWAEYLSWRNARIMTSAQYELADRSWFTSGLLFADGQPKPAFYAYRLPLFLPHTITTRGRSLEVWGDVRPAPYARADTGQAQFVSIQFRARSWRSFRTIKSVLIKNPSGYFDVRVKFGSSGAVRLAWPYPLGDARLNNPLMPGQHWIHSRIVNVTIRSARHRFRRGARAAART